MKNKFKFLLGDVYFKHLKTKSFVISNVVLFIVILLLANIQPIINFFGGDFDEAKYIIIDCEQNEYSDLITKSLSDNINGLNIGNTRNYVIITPSEETEDMNVIYELDVSYVNEEFNVTKIIYDDNTIDEQIINNAINQSYNDLLETINPVLAASVEKVNDSLKVTDDIQYEQENNDLDYLVSLALSLVIFMAILLSMQFIGGEIVEEKSSRMIETILSNVNAKTHFLSKLVGIILFLLTQLLLFAAYGFIAMGISSVISSSSVSSAVSSDLTGVLDVIYKVLPLALLKTVPFIFFGFLLYSIIVALLASMSATMQEYSQYQAPITICLLVGFYLGIFSWALEGSIIIKICGFIPLFSPILAPLLYSSGDMTLQMYLISFAVLVATTYIVYRMTLPIYKVSLLDYSETKFTEKMKKSLNRSKNK